MVLLPSPPSQSFLQSLEVALRGLFSLAKFVSAVVGVDFPGAVDDGDHTRVLAVSWVSRTFSVPSLALMPTVSRHSPLPDSVSSPSELAVPLSVIGLLPAPPSFSAVGQGDRGGKAPDRSELVEVQCRGVARERFHAPVAVALDDDVAGREAGER